jgi:cytidine deaminase
MSEPGSATQNGARNASRIEELIGLAGKARERAYAPYSGFAVGAVVESADGRVFTGCNVENASYGLTICAERVALCKAISEGARPARVVVIAATPGPISPCGACREFIFELGGAHIEVVLANIEGAARVLSAVDLLPMPFERGNLDHHPLPGE